MARIAVLDDVGARPARSRSERLDRERASRRVPVALIVEDDRSTLHLFRDVARDAGWEPVESTRLAHARAEIERRRPDLIILDDDLPDGRGGDLARELAEDPRFRDVAVVVCTAAHPIRQAEIADWAPVVAKPFDLDELLHVLHDAGRRFERDGGRAAG